LAVLIRGEETREADEEKIGSHVGPTPRRSPGDRSLRVFLRVVGVIDALSLAAVIMPDASMAAAHERLGLGELHPTPLLGYLARSASLLYAVHGAIIVFVSFDTVRYRPLIRFLAWTALLHGLALAAID
jgi:hypothetical protein